MTLLKPGIGDVIDRLTILQRKIIEGKRREISVAHFEEEREALIRYLEGKHVALPWLGYIIRLATLNAALWDATEKMLHDEDTWGRAIFNWNLERATLVGSLNRIEGDCGEEKIL